MVKCLPATWETWVRSLDQEDPLEKEMATHSSTLAWKIPWTEKPGRLQSMGSQRVEHNWATSFSFPFFLVTVYIIHIKCMFINVKCSSIWCFGYIWSRKQIQLTFQLGCVRNGGKYWDWKVKHWDFPGGPVVKTPHLQCKWHRFSPWLGIEHPTCSTAKKI